MYTARGIYDGFEDVGEFADRLDDCEACDASKDQDWAGATCCGPIAGNCGPTGVGGATTVLVKIGWCLL